MCHISLFIHKLMDMIMEAAQLSDYCDKQNNEQGYTSVSVISYRVFRLYDQK